MAESWTRCPHCGRRAIKSVHDELRQFWCWLDGEMALDRNEGAGVCARTGPDAAEDYANLKSEAEMDGDLVVVIVEDDQFNVTVYVVTIEVEVTYTAEPNCQRKVCGHCGAPTTNAIVDRFAEPLKYGEPMPYVCPNCLGHLMRAARATLDEWERLESAAHSEDRIGEDQTPRHPQEV